jgi:hypothetical protein
MALVDIARLASEIDQKLKAEDAEPAGLLAELQRAFDTALVSISEYAPQQEIAASPPLALDPVRAAQVAPILADLLRILDADNPDGAEPLLKGLAKLLPAEFLRTVSMMLNDFDFRGAEAATRQLAEKLGISLKN